MYHNYVYRGWVTVVATEGFLGVSVETPMASLSHDGDGTSISTHEASVRGTQLCSVGNHKSVVH